MNDPDWIFGQLSDEEAQSLNQFANTHPHQCIQVALWFQLNVAMSEDAREEIVRTCEALAEVMPDDA